MRNAKTAAKRTASDTLRIPGELRGTMWQGRWLLVVAETLVSLFVLARGQESTLVWLTLAALGVYNGLSILMMRRTALPQFLVPVMLGLDLVFVLLAARLTGGAQSPFLAQGYLIILAAALLYDLTGGVVVAAASCAIVFLSQYPQLPSYPLRVHVLGTLIPSYLLVGGFTGYLVRHLKSYYKRDVAARLREQETDHEMRLAREMQEASLPPGPPKIPGLECAFVTRFAGEVGGDFLLFLLPETDREPEPLIGLIIGDVMGKGIAGALAATGIVHLLPWLRPLNDPVKALRSLNDDLNERLPSDYYATLLLAEVSADRLRLWSAGHSPALLWRAAEGRVLTGNDAFAAPPLGLLPGWQGNPEEFPWGVGDVLLLYTDGASETRSHEGEQFTSARIAAVLAGCASSSGAEIVQTVLQAVEDWGTPTDDLTLAVCRRTA